VNVFRHIGCVIAAGCRLRAAYAAQIDSDDREPLRQSRHDCAILEPILWKPVDQNDGRAVSPANIVKSDPIHRGGLGCEFRVWFCRKWTLIPLRPGLCKTDVAPRYDEQGDEAHTPKVLAAGLSVDPVADRARDVEVPGHHGFNGRSVARRKTARPCPLRAAVQRSEIATGGSGGMAKKR
jgi:hypothetical protein